MPDEPDSFQSPIAERDASYSQRGCNLPIPVAQDVKPIPVAVLEKSNEI